MRVSRIGSPPQGTVERDGEHHGPVRAATGPPMSKAVRTARLWPYRATLADKGHGDKERSIMADNEEDERVEDPPAKEEAPTNQDDNGPEPEPPTPEEESDKAEDDDIDKRVRSLEQDIKEIRAMIDALGIDDDDTVTAEDTATDGDVDDDGEPDPTDITLEDILERK